MALILRALPGGIGATFDIAFVGTVLVPLALGILGGAEAPRCGR
jgi:hypothetical protein